MTDTLKTTSGSLAAAASQISGSADNISNTKGTLSSHLKSSSIDTGKYAVETVISDVLWGIINKIPADVATIVDSYANGLLHLDQVVTSADQQLHNNAQGLMASSVGALVGAGALTLSGSRTQPQGTAALLESPPEDALSAYGTPAAALKAFETASAASNNWGDDALQCTSWANFRRQQLGLSTNIRGNGGEMVGGQAASALSAVGPSRVSIGSLVSEGGDPGHVMVVEKVLNATPGHYVFQVSEMNYKGDDAGEISLTSQLQQNANGSWTLMRPSSTTDASSPLVLGWQDRTGLLFSTGVAG